MASWFQYSVTRPFTIRYFTALVVILGVIWGIVVLAVAIAAVGYELYPQTSDSFNVTTNLWYEHVFPQVGWFPSGRTCEGSIIKTAESKNIT